MNRFGHHCNLKTDWMMRWYLSVSEESIGWVQCDRCELWFHFTCLGLEADSISNEDFVCEACEEISSEISTQSKESSTASPTNCIVELHSHNVLSQTLVAV